MSRSIEFPTNPDGTVRELGIATITNAPTPEAASAVVRLRDAYAKWQAAKARSAEAEAAAREASAAEDQADAEFRDAKQAHLEAALNGDDTASQVKVYVDGVLQDLANQLRRQ